MRSAGYYDHGHWVLHAYAENLQNSGLVVLDSYDLFIPTDPDRHFFWFSELFARPKPGIASGESLVFAGIVLPLLVVTLHTLDWIPGMAWISPQLLSP